MSGINFWAHNKLIDRFRSSIGNNGEAGIDPMDEDVQSLNADINELQKIIDEYKTTFFRLQHLVQRYRVLLQRTRGNMRKRQLKLIRGRAPKSGLKAEH